MYKLTEALITADRLVWGAPTLLLILGCGALLTVRLRGLQFKKLGRALRYAVTPEPGGDGEVSGFAALCTALSATIGTGNIVGVATAVAAGGPGALFWMEAAALLGMATKFAEGFLAVKYRARDAEGRIMGGPFCYIEYGMGARWKPLAKAFALFGALAGLMGIGTITQVHGIVSAANSFFADSRTLRLFGGEHTLVTLLTGGAVTLLTALVMLGGIRRISRVAGAVVPFMAAAYVLCTLTILLTHAAEIPAAISEIFLGAFGLRPLAGAAAGSTVTAALRAGVSRGIFSNEAGLGSAPIAAAAAKTRDPVRQGLVTMTGTFIDTICICTMTGLTIVISGAWRGDTLEGAAITAAAFGYGLPFPRRVSALILMLCLAFFAFTTIIGWSYYSERCLAYLCGGRRVRAAFTAAYILMVTAAPYLSAQTVWCTADIFNALMAIPNVTALIALSGETAKIVNSEQ